MCRLLRLGEMAGLRALFEHIRNEAMGNLYVEVAGRPVGLGYGSERGNLEVTSVLMSGHAGGPEQQPEPGSEAQPQFSEFWEGLVKIVEAASTVHKM